MVDGDARTSVMCIICDERFEKAHITSLRRPPRQQPAPQPLGRAFTTLCRELERAICCSPSRPAFALTINTLTVERAEVGARRVELALQARPARMACALALDALAVMAALRGARVDLTAGAKPVEGTLAHAGGAAFAAARAGVAIAIDRARACGRR